jgi:hypothetical protein
MFTQRLAGRKTKSYSTFQKGLPYSSDIFYTVTGVLFLKLIIFTEFRK